MFTTPQKIVIGLTGEIGAGKSTAAETLRFSGARVIDADKIAHQALASAENQERLREIFGERIFSRDVHAEIIIDRKKLGMLVFNSAEKLAALEKILHPWIKEKITAKLNCARHKNWLTVIDAPLLKQLRLDEQYAWILQIIAPFDLRLRRVREQRGWSESELRLRDSRQKKHLYASTYPRVFTMVNDGDISELQDKILDWLDEHFDYFSDTPKEGEKV